MEGYLSHQPSLVSVVLPCFNESRVIKETHRRLTTILDNTGLSFEIIYVDDGSWDNTAEIVREMQQADSRIRLLRLSRNFGHQVATTAGLEHTTGDVVVLMDADLQDPPEIIIEMLEKWREGYDVAYGTRIARKGESGFKLWSAKAFYRVISRISEVPIPLDTGDFRLMDRAVVNALLAMPERDRFLRGMVAWVGFRQISVPYVRDVRFAGTTKYTMARMFKFARNGLVSFSDVPLKVATLFGFACSAIALLWGIYALAARIFTRAWVPGWTSIFLAVLFVGGVQLICLGVIGEYIGRIYGESKKRPLYFISERVGFTDKLVPFVSSCRGEAGLTIAAGAEK